MRLGKYRSRQNRAGYWIIFWYFINTVLEPIGMVPNRVCDVTVFSLFLEDKYLMAIHWIWAWIFHGTHLQLSAVTQAEIILYSLRVFFWPLHFIPTSTSAAARCPFSEPPQAWSPLPASSPLPRRCCRSTATSPCARSAPCQSDGQGLSSLEF